MRVFLFSIIGYLTVGSGVAWAQWQLLVENYEVHSSVLSQHYQAAEYENQAAAVQAVRNLVRDLQQSGYFEATWQAQPAVDSLVYPVRVDPGQPFHWAYLKAGNLDPLLQAHSGYREELFLQQPFQYTDFQKLVDNCLDYAENSGYPFALVRLTNIEVSEHKVSAALDYQSGPLIRFGELNVQGTDKINPEFLEAYLGVRTGTVYSEDKIEQITARLQQLPFVSLSGAVKVRFQNEVADLYLPLTYQASSQVDGILSVLPDEGKHGGVLLTGELNVLLRNLGRSGKNFSLSWQRLQLASQQLSIEYEHPNILRTPLGVEANFKLLKEDTLFLNQQINVALSYLVKGNQQLSIFGDWRSSRLIGDGTPTTGGNNSALSNVTVRGGGMRYRWSKVDYPLFPRRGFLFSVHGRIGQKTTSFWMNEPIQSGQLTLQSGTSIQWANELYFAQYYMLGSSLGIYNRIRGGWLADSQLFVNELYRIGGIQNLRGFTDNFFFASQYALSNLELRWLLEPESTIPSYLFMFYDHAWLKRNEQEVHSVDFPLGIGAGISVKTSAGLFSLVYGLGKSQNQLMNFSSSKVHFGYISRF